MVNKKLLELKIKLKKKTPKFCRKDNNKKARIEDDVWRKARGTDNKSRLHMKGHRRGPSTGFRTPVEVRGIHNRTGLMPVLVSNERQLATITKEQGIIIASVGDRKRQLILQEAKKNQITVINLDATKVSEQIAAGLKLRQAAKQKNLEEQKKSEEKKKDDKKEHKKHESKAEAPAEPVLSDEEKQDQEKEEKNKVLTMKQ